MNILAIDVGTSSVKSAVLARDRGEPLGAIARAGYELDHPTPEAAEIAPRQLWDAVTAAARQAVAGAGGAHVAGVGLAGLTPALVLLGAGDEPLTPIWTHLDRRSRALAKRIDAEVGVRFLEAAGTRPLPGGISALCFARQVQDDPGLRDRVRAYLHLNGWLAFRMTGVRAFDPANASFSGLWGTLTDRKWSPEWCDYFGVDPAWLPEVRDGRATVGGLRKEVAEEWGVPAGLPVKLGTADTSSSILAAGMGPGDMLHSVGTTQVLARLVKDPRPDPRRLTRHLGVGDAFVYVTHNPVGGVALQWIYHLCFRDQKEGDFYRRTVPEAMGRRTRVRLDPPFLGGDRLEIEERLASFRRLTLSTDRMDLLAALLAAMREGHYAAYAALDWGNGPAGTVYLTGGGAELVKRLIPEYGAADVKLMQRGSLRGVAKLFEGE
ncbi:MAG TPA: FGGY-family carbohydrate kinase [Gemmataceae bacterium]